MNSRERVALALNHQEADRVPLDLGGSGVTGMHASSVYRLRQALGLDAPGTPVKVVDPFMILGEIEPDLIDALGVDVVPLPGRQTIFGFENEGWKPWTLFDDTPVLVPEHFNTDPEPNGDILMYPEGDKSAPPSGRMPHGGFYFDVIVRQPPIDDSMLSVEDNLEEFGPLSDADVAYFRGEAERLYTHTDKAIFANVGGTGFGDIALVPASMLRYPKGIRDVEEWYVSTISRRDYVYKVFEGQCEVALGNLASLHEAVGDRASVILISGTDFGTQAGPFISRKTYRELYMPFLKAENDWVHAHTPWKTFLHTCGSIMPLIPDFIETGFDILNPVQFSAANMDSRELKRAFGDRITFWGGGVNTQQTLPFGTAEDVRREVQQQIEIFAPGGRFRLQYQSQRPGRRAGRESAGPLRRGRGVPRLLLRETSEGSDLRKLLRLVIGWLVASPDRRGGFCPC